MVPPPQFAVLSAAQDALLDLMSGYGPPFWAIGIHLFQSFALIQIVMFGLTMMSTRHGAHDFIGFFLYLSFGYAMITFYGAPIPGIGIAFADLIPDMAKYCANLLDAGATRQINENLDVISSRIIAPDVWNISQNIMYVILLVLIAFAKLMALLTVMGSLIVQSIIVLLGGIFVPFFIVPVPHLTRLFWGWLNALMVASFCRVVGFAYLMVFASVLNKLVVHHLPPAIVAEFFPLYIVECIALVGVFTVGAVGIPIITAMLFSSSAPPTMRVPGVTGILS